MKPEHRRQRKQAQRQRTKEPRQTLLGHPVEISMKVPTQALSDGLRKAEQAIKNFSRGLLARASARALLYGEPGRQPVGMFGPQPPVTQPLSGQRVTIQPDPFWIMEVPVEWLPVDQPEANVDWLSEGF